MRYALTHITVVFLFLAGPTHASDVVVVDAFGGGDFTDLPAAVQASKDGDIILMRAGTYTAMSLPDRQLSIVADNAGTVALHGTLALPALSPEHVLLLQGLHFEGQNINGFALRIEGAEGSVLLDECTITGVDGPNLLDGGGALLVVDSPGVAVLKSTARGGHGGLPAYDFYTVGGTGLEVRDSRVAAWRSFFYGGDGGYGFGEKPGGYAGPGAELFGGSDLFGLYDYFQGGDGGGSDDYLAPVCAPGEAGLRVNLGGTVHDQSCVYVGGKGGDAWVFNYTCDDGPGLELAGGMQALVPGAPRALIASRLARETQTVQLDFHGQPGDRVRLVVSTATELRPALARHGVWIVPRSAPVTHAELGTIGGSGKLTVVRSVPELGAGVEGRVLYAQALMVDTSGEPHISSPSTVVLLDGGF